MFIKIIFVFLLSLTFMYCHASVQTDIVDVHITPASYQVSQAHFSIATEAVNEAIYQNPTKVNILACAAMPTKRIVDFMSELRGKYKGKISLGNLVEGCDSL